MGFFDLNIPYTESDKHVADKQSRKATRLKLLLKAMELGYTGIAYNHTIRGVMSESDRCSISLFPLSSLLKLSPSLSSTVNLHRRLLNVPESTPFRQYTRLTVVVDSPAQAAALNSGNPVLKSYDIVAVRPLNQTVFEHACQTSEVNLIAIDFEKTLFRLKQSMVKAAMKRGVCFEVTYSSLIMDAQVRRQVISNAKLLVDWTRGKNLIFSSAAPSVTEIRGPSDVANLSMLFGISMERAKEAISKTCRSLLANSLRKKQFYKDAIRVEVIPSAEKLDVNESKFDDWLKWDPISSGDGDLQLDDMAKSFCAASKASKPVKAINFASIIDSLPSHGLHIKDFVTGTKVASVPPDISKKICATAEPDIAVAVHEECKESNQLNLYEKDQAPVIKTPDKDHTLFSEGSKSSAPSETLVSAIVECGGVDTAKDMASLVKAPEKHHIAICKDSKLSPPTETLNGLDSMEDVRDDIVMVEEETKLSNDLDVYFVCPETDVQDLKSQGCRTISEKHIMLGDDDNAEVDTEISSGCNVVSTTEVSTPPKDIHSSALQSEEATNVNFQLPLVSLTAVVNDVSTHTDVKSEDTLSLTSSGTPLHEGFSVGKQLTETGTVAPLDELISLGSYDMMQNTLLNSTQTLSEHDLMETECANIIRVHEPPEDVMIEDQTQVEDGTGINSPHVLESFPERIRRNQRTSHRAHLFPFKRVLNPTPFKKKARRFKN